MKNSMEIAHMTHRYKTNPLLSGCLFMLLTILFLSPAIATRQGLNAASIEKPFKQILMAHPDIADSSGARVVKMDQNSLALIGVSQIAQNGTRAEDEQSLIRIGAIKARTNILKFSHGVEVSTYRGTAERTEIRDKAKGSMTLSSFFQVTEERVSGRIEQLPVIGSWWDKDHRTFYVAVGALKNTNGPSETLPQKNVEHNSTPSSKSPQINIKGVAPFVDLLQASPVLRDNGGVRLFSINDQKCVIMAVASAKITSSRAKAERIARIKAIRELLAHKNGVQLSSVEYLADGEMMQITNAKTERVMLSEFLSIQEESVSGFVKGLPVVARWSDLKDEALNICIGDLLQLGTTE